VVRLLIEVGANINGTGAEGDTALHYAAEQGYEDMVALLLDKGAHANSRDHYGRTPLMRACGWGHLGVVEMLVEHMQGKGLDERAETGWAALHWAAAKGYTKVVRFLLLAGADPTITDDEGTTPRAIAEENHYYDERIRRRRARCVAVFQVRPVTC
jgi:ankyrin repeat protein